jgi:putative DNA methylase
MVAVKSPRKLIEVALPLDDINTASAKEKSIRHGHPSTLHLWWARRPLATARAVLFAQMVNDPGYERNLQRGVNKKEAAIERDRLFTIIKKLVLWENTNNEQVLQEAREEIWKSWRETCALNRNHPEAAELFNPDKLPAFHDPFAGGGALPLEAQRLGLKSYASDLNPVAVLINKAMIDIPPRFKGKPPVGPLQQRGKQKELVQDWSGVQGLAEDVRRYGQWMRNEAQQRIGHLYPQVEITPEMAKSRPDLEGLVGKKLTVIAWLWARTVKSPNPAYSHCEVPLASSFLLSDSEGKEAYIEPEIKADGYRFTVRSGKPANAGQIRSGTKAEGRGANFLCLLSGTPIDGRYIRTEGQSGRIGTRLMAVVVESSQGRIYLSPTPEMESVAQQIRPAWQPDVEFFEQALGFRVGNYGFKTWADLFTPRQLVALTTFSDLVNEARERVKAAARAAGMPDDGVSLDDGGGGATAYADAVSVYLALGVSRMADICNSLCRWETSKTQVRNLFGRQAISMIWDFAEPNIFAHAAGDFGVSLATLAKVLDRMSVGLGGNASQADAARQTISAGKVISTDPPYYDNVGYADLSDFFYVWLRRSLKPVFPGLFATLAVPKAEELVATPARHGGKDASEAFFLQGMTRAMQQLAEQAHPAFPLTIYYAFKAAETVDRNTASTGWETFLEAVLKAGFSISGTWPMRTELGNRMRGKDSNALASSIVLVCRTRGSAAGTVSRREFIRELNSLLPEALDEMTRGSVNSPVAPVDLSQAIIGPGMAVFSKYAAVLEADGTQMSVRTALGLINRFLAEDDFDHDTQFCLHWFESHGWGEGKFGEADVLARSKGTSVSGVAEAGVIKSGQGTVRLLRYSDYPNEWLPESDSRTPVWEALHHLIRALQTDGEAGSGALVAKIPTRMESIRQLAYRLYTLCERKGWADDARAYNELITSWSAIESASHAVGHVGKQTEFDY